MATFILCDFPGCEQFATNRVLLLPIQPDGSTRGRMNNLIDVCDEHVTRVSLDDSEKGTTDGAPAGQ